MVESQQVVWRLRGSCPICEQGTSLLLMTCPTCSHIAVICQEEGSAFSDFRTIRAEAVVDPDSTRCPRCSSVVLREFLFASSGQLQAAGLRADEYS